MSQISAAPSIDLTRPVRDWVEPVRTTLKADHTVEDALATLRTRQIDHHITYFYVVDESDRLLGVVPTRRLLLAAPHDRIHDLMHSPVVSLKATDTLDVALDVFATHRYLALPVVEDDNRLVGTIGVQLYADEAFDIGDMRRSADAFQLIGVWTDRLRQASPWRAFRLRMPWLLCNMAGGLVCAIIATVFGAVVERVLVVAAFIPLVLTLCEGIAIQSLTLGLQGMGGRIRLADVAALAGRESQTGVMIGVCSGLIVALATLAWGLALAPPIAIGASVAAAMIIAALLGITVPSLLHAFRLDPKIAAGPVVLMSTDSVAMLLYLSVATLLLL